MLSWASLPSQASTSQSEYLRSTQSLQCSSGPPTEVPDHERDLLAKLPQEQLLQEVRSSHASEEPSPLHLLDVERKLLSPRQLPRAAVLDPAVRAFQEQRAVVANPASQTVQAMFWPERARGKRGPPTPVASSLVTPQEDVPAFDHTAPTLVQPWLLEDASAAQVTAGTFGVQVQNPQEMEAWLNRREQARQLQKHAAGTQLVTSGWPNGLSPAQREYMLSWMLQQVPKIRTFLEARGHLTDHNAQETHRWFNVFAVEPVTVPQGDGFWSAMTMLHFKSFDLRSAFLEKFGGSGGTPIYSDDQTAIPNKHVRVSPSSPQWQRKLEAPLRVILACLNEHEEYHGKTFTILWKTLTIMAPTEGRSYAPDAQAWARLHYFEDGGSFKGRLEITPPLMEVLQSTPQDVEATEKTLWEHCWNKVIWGAQFDLDRAEREAFTKAKIAAGAVGKGISKGKGRRHWSAALIHNNYYNPYPFEITTPVVEAVAYCWDEYCTKMGRADECVGDFNVATYQGKPGGVPAADTDAGGDVPMADGTRTLSQAASSFASAGADHTATPKGFSFEHVRDELLGPHRHSTEWQGTPGASFEANEEYPHQGGREYTAPQLPVHNETLSTFQQLESAMHNAETLTALAAARNAEADQDHTAKLERGNPIYDLEYADDTLLISLTTPQLQHFLQVHVYNLTEGFVKANSLLSVATRGSVGAFHVGVEVFGGEWSYGLYGVSVSPPRQQTRHVYKCSVLLGETELNEVQFAAVLRSAFQVGTLASADPCPPNAAPFIRPEGITDGETVQFASHWAADAFTVTYYSTYKVIKYNAALTELRSGWPNPELRGQAPPDLVLYECGTTQPTTSFNDVSEDAWFFSVPISKLAFYGTNPVHFFEMLSVTEAIILHDLTYTGSPCMQLLEVCTPGLHASSSSSDWVPLAMDADAVFTDAWGGGASNTTKDVVFAMSVDSGILPRAEWIRFVALFFNLEVTAGEIFRKVVADYRSLQSEADRLAAARETGVPSVAWVTHQGCSDVVCDGVTPGSWRQKADGNWCRCGMFYLFSNSLFKRDITQDAGARLLPMPGQAADGCTLTTNSDGSGTYECNQDGLEHYLQHLASADVIIDETYRLNHADYTLDDFISSFSLGGSSVTLKAREAQAVYRVDGSVSDPNPWTGHVGSGWFEQMPAQPQTLLSDLMHALYGDAFAGPCGLTYMRNLYSSQTRDPQEHSDCPLYDAGGSHDCAGIHAYEHQVHLCAIPANPPASESDTGPDPLALGLGLGLGIPLVLLVVGIAAYFFCFRKPTPTPVTPLAGGTAGPSTTEEFMGEHYDLVGHNCCSFGRHLVKDHSECPEVISDSSCRHRRQHCHHYPPPPPHHHNTITTITIITIITMITVITIATTTTTTTTTTIIFLLLRLLIIIIFLLLLLLLLIMIIIIIIITIAIIIIIIIITIIITVAITIIIITIIIMIIIMTIIIFISIIILIIIIIIIILIFSISITITSISIELGVGPMPHWVDRLARGLKKARSSVGRATGRVSEHVGMVMATGHKAVTGAAAALRFGGWEDASEEEEEDELPGEEAAGRTGSAGPSGGSPSYLQQNVIVAHQANGLPRRQDQARAPTFAPGLTCKFSIFRPRHAITPRFQPFFVGWCCCRRCCPMGTARSRRAQTGWLPTDAPTRARLAPDPVGTSRPSRWTAEQVFKIRWFRVQFPPLLMLGCRRGVVNFIRGHCEYVLRERSEHHGLNLRTAVPQSQQLQWCLILASSISPTTTGTRSRTPMLDTTAVPITGHTIARCGTVCRMCRATQLCLQRHSPGIGAEPKGFTLTQFYWDKCIPTACTMKGVTKDSFGRVERKK
ncbi:hypothetical protein AK812_SmicGene22815 [Symbiodinium microadriaticum]|uniref:PPPDE domain-containing protein n=1 Tax=Symbiodinium microadriaticum TaxID=2951 RepID=A0A1Q9DIW7_SYMMI|nr:hypothetical protein AK812_SmicGene22815 [Symbiodinium microadriaticum]